MSMRAAINAKCKDCIYDDCAPGNWRQQVAACTISTCSLWPYRPKSKPRAIQAAGEGGSVQKVTELVPE
jgi:hypothetical protein